MIVRYFPKNASATIAPKIGKKYTAVTNTWNHALACSFVMGSSSPLALIRNLVMKMTKIARMP